jgi:hypothetical protein
MLSFTPGAAAASIKRQCPNVARIRLLSGRLHALGPGPLYRFLCEVADGRDIWNRLEVYAQLDPDTVRVFGGDQLPQRVWIVYENPDGRK